MEYIELIDLDDENIYLFVENEADYFGDDL